MIDIDKYEGHTTTHWSARNQGVHNHKHLLYGSLDSCDDDYCHDEPFLETDGGNIAIGYFRGGRYIHSTEEKRANMRLMADAPLLLEEVKRLREAFVIAVRHVGYHHSQDDLWYALRKRGMDDLYDDDEDFGEWEE